VGDYLTSWMQTGKSPGQTWYGYGGQGCNTNFKTALTVRNTEGMPRTLDRITAKGQTEFVYPQVGNGDKVGIDVQTFGEGSKGKSDKVTVSLRAINLGYMIGKMESLLATKTDEEQAAIVKNTDLFVEELMSTLSPSSLVVTLRSLTINTDNDGMGRIEIFVEPEWPPGPLFLNCHYGYSAGGERDDWDKSLELFFTEILPLVVDLALVAVIVLASCAGPQAAAVCAPAIGAGQALLVAEIAYVLHRMAEDGYGTIDENKYDCRFPIPGGFNHTYSLNLVETIENKLTPIIRASPVLEKVGNEATSNPAVSASMSQSQAVSSVSGTNQMVLLMLVLVGAYFIMAGDE